MYYCRCGGFCQALFLRRQTDAILEGWGRLGEFDTWGCLAGLDSRGVSMREQVLVFCSHGVKVREQVLVFCSYGVKVRRCGDTFHPPEKLTLYLKVTPFDSKTPTHFRTKVPIGGYVLRSFTA